MFKVLLFNNREQDADGFMEAVLWEDAGKPRIVMIARDEVMRFLKCMAAEEGPITGGPYLNGQCAHREIRPSNAVLIERIHHYIESHLDMDVRLQSIANHVHIHPVYLSKIYKSITGINLSEFIFTFRMKKARTLLEETSVCIYDIADKLGYRSSSNFIREFRKYYNVTPQLFRKKR